MRAGLLLVGAGAALGGPARHLLDTAVGSTTPSGHLPWGTFTVNVLGALLLGLLVTWAGHRRRLLLLLGTGFLGAFTTFSSLALQVVQLSGDGREALAAGYAVVSLVTGLLAAWAGTLVGPGLPSAGVTAPDDEDPR